MENNLFTKARYQAWDIMRLVVGLDFADAVTKLSDRNDISIIRLGNDYCDVEYKSIVISFYKTDEGKLWLGRLVEFYDPKSDQIKLFTLPHADSIEYYGEKYKAAHLTLDDDRDIIAASRKLLDATTNRDDSSETDRINELVDIYVPEEKFDDLMELLDFVNDNI